MDNSEKIILDLCGGTGSWSRPYKQAGYDVRVITYPEYDVRAYEPPENVYGILAAPPCTDFSVACAWAWKQKDADGRTEKSLSVVHGCLSVIERCKPRFWVMENPVGRLRHYIGKPNEVLCYSQFGCPYQKKVCLWGKYVTPFRLFSSCVGVPAFENSDGLMGRLPDGYQADHSDRAARRSITWPGFAEAFFLANQ